MSYMPCGFGVEYCILDPCEHGSRRVLCVGTFGKRIGNKQEGRTMSIKVRARKGEEKLERVTPITLSRF